MPAPLLYPTINGARHSWASVELKLNGIVYVGVKAINYSRKRNRSMVRGQSPDPLGKTRGTNEYAADIELFLAEYNLFQAALVQAAQAAGLGNGYGDVTFQVLVSYVENGFDTIQDVINGCTMDSTEASNSEGTDGTTRKFEMAPLKIFFNGVDDLAVPLVAPAT